MLTALQYSQAFHPSILENILVNAALARFGIAHVISVGMFWSTRYL